MEAQLRRLLDPEATDARAKADQAALIERFGGPAKAINVGAPGSDAGTDLKAARGAI